MTRHWLALLSLLLCVPGSAAPAAAAYERFQGFDQNGDGIVEIRSVTVEALAGEAGPLVLVLVEPRLLEALPDAPDLAPLLKRFADDLFEEGYQAQVLAVELGESDLHQDGRYILALRELLREANDAGALAGAILVGRFPDAFIVRTCNWRKRGSITLHQGTDAQTTHTDVHYLRRVPEDVARRADIVLSDLDGAWESVYLQPRMQLQSTLAVFAGSVPKYGGECLDFEQKSLAYEDFFHVSDGKLEVSRLDAADGEEGRPWVTLFDGSGDHECSSADRQRPNIIARPDILVSRIDARGTALVPKASVVGVDGAGLLDAEGRPRAVQFATPEEVPSWASVWEFSPQLERRLLAEYFERNHAYRRGTGARAWRPASLACDLGSGYAIMQRAAGDWEDTDARRADVHGRPTLMQVADWFAYPALLRTVRAHSDPWGSNFKKAEAAGLDARLGGPAWSWTQRGDSLVPSLAAACEGGRLDWFLLRSLWEYGLVAPEPAFYLYTGCNGISPPGGGGRPFDHPGYGDRQGAEAMLFHASGLALVGRAKVFYDEPLGFAEALGAGETFGAAWARYFDLESQAASWGKAGGDIGRKRSYFWSVLGDWTLQLRRPDAGTDQ